MGAEYENMYIYYADISIAIHFPNECAAGVLTTMNPSLP